MSQLAEFKDYVRTSHHQVTLWSLLRSKWAAEYRKMHTLLRREGWKVVVELNRKVPGRNLYRFQEPSPPKERIGERIPGDTLSGENWTRPEGKGASMSAWDKYQHYRKHPAATSL